MSSTAYEHSELSAQRMSETDVPDSFGLNGTETPEQISQFRELTAYVTKGAPENQALVNYLMARCNDGKLIEGNEGLLQATVNGVIKLIKNGEITGSIKPDLLRVAYNVTRNYRIADAVKLDSEFETTTDTLPNPEAQALSAVDNAHLLAALQTMTQAQALAITLDIFEPQLSDAEIGIIINALIPTEKGTEGASKARLLRARRILPYRLKAVPEPSPAEIELYEFDKHDVLTYVISGLNKDLFYELLMEKNITGTIARKPTPVPGQGSDADLEDIEGIIEEDEKVGLDQSPVTDDALLSNEQEDEEPLEENARSLQVERVLVPFDEQFPPPAEIAVAVEKIQAGEAIIEPTQKTHGQRIDEFLQAVQREYPRLLRYAFLRTGNKSINGVSHEDLVQDVLENIYRKVVVEEYVVNNITPYIFGALANRVATYYREAVRLSRLMGERSLSRLPSYHKQTEKAALAKIAKESKAPPDPRLVQAIEPDPTPALFSSKKVGTLAPSLQAALAQHMRANSAVLSQSPEAKGRHQLKKQWEVQIISDDELAVEPQLFESVYGRVKGRRTETSYPPLPDRSKTPLVDSHPLEADKPLQTEKTPPIAGLLELLDELYRVANDAPLLDRPIPAVTTESSRVAHLYALRKKFPGLFKPQPLRLLEQRDDLYAIPDDAPVLGPEPAPTVTVESDTTSHLKALKGKLSQLFEPKPLRFLEQRDDLYAIPDDAPVLGPEPAPQQKLLPVLNHLYEIPKNAPVLGPKSPPIPERPAAKAGTPLGKGRVMKTSNGKPVVTKVAPPESRRRDTDEDDESQVKRRTPKKRTTSDSKQAERVEFLDTRETSSNFAGLEDKNVAAILYDSIAKGSPDQNAINELYDRFEGRIYSYIYLRTPDPTLAEDLTAKVFLKMLEAIRGDKAWHSSFSGWLYRIAHNIVIDYYRQRDREQQVDIESIAETAAEDNPLALLEDSIDAERIIKTIDNSLTQEQAEVIKLRFFNGYSNAEVAEKLNKTEGSIRALQYRGLQTLRQAFLGQGYV